MRWEEKICSKLIRDNIVKADEKDIILYGIHQGKTLSLNILTLFFVCLIFESIC